MAVFGPDRPNAARRAIAELKQAEKAVADAGGSWVASGKQLKRLSNAKKERKQYQDYSDDFAGH